MATQEEWIKRLYGKEEHLWKFNFTIADLKRQYAGVGLTAPFATIYPKDAPLPNASNINGVENTVVPNMAVLKYGTNTQVTVYNSTGNMDYVFDAQAVVLE